MRRFAIMLILLLLAGCGVAPAPVVPAALSTVSSPPSEPGLNPHVTLPPGRIQVAPNLPTVTAPAGMVSQQSVVDQVLAAHRADPARLTLSRVTFDTANTMWEVALTVDDANIAVEPRSHPNEATSSDPVERRKELRSWWCVASELHGFVDGRTGEGKGGGHACKAVERSRTDLEHYRGVILTGGETVVLRLLNPDGTPEGRDLTVNVPQDVLDAAHLGVWQVQYGINRTLEVWGLTGPSKQVVAYRVAMPEPPPQSLLQWNLFDGVPFYPGAFILPRVDSAQGPVLSAPGAGPAAVLSWYSEQMPKFGWQKLPGKAAAESVLQFKGAGGVVEQLSVTQAADGTHIAITWPSGRPAG